MAPPHRTRPIRPKDLPGVLSPPKTRAIVFSESARPSPTLVPNVRSPAWNPTGTLLAHSMTTTIRVWDPERADVRASTEMKDPGAGAAGGRTSSAAPAYAHEGKVVEKVQFCPRSEALLASTAMDGVVKLWDVRLPGGATGLSGPGAGGGTGGGGTASKGGVTHKAGEHRLVEPGMFLTWHPDGTELLSGTRNDSIQALDVRKLDAPVLDITAAAAAASPALKYELVASDRSPNKPRDENNKARWFFGPMAFSPSGSELIASTTEGAVYIYDYPSMSALHVLRAHNTSTYAVQCSPTGSWIAVGSSDSLITLWDTRTLLATHVLGGKHAAAVRDLSFSPDGIYLVAGHGQDGLKDGERGLHVFQADTGECAHTVETGHPVRDVAWHPLRYAIAYSGDPGGLRVVGSLTM